MSDRDLEAGQRWNEEISAKLRNTHFGIICLTRENLAVPWLLFEAGALAKAVDSARIVPVLLGVGRSDLTFPLAQFQAVGSDESGMRSLAAAVNNALGMDRLPATTLDNIFRGLWSGLAAAIAAIPESPFQDGSHRTDRQLLEELVEGLHQVQRSLPPRRGVSSPAELDEEDWEDYYIRGVNLANQHGDSVVNLAALQAQSNAIALAPASLPDNLRSRLYAYRAALYKRLNRLEEAEQDLVLAQRWATEEREVSDALYNLACVLAMGATPHSALPVIRRLLEQSADWAGIITSKPHYFGKLLNDPEFEKLIGRSNESRQPLTPKQNRRRG
jgi:tetratricopeptide (TPR) repeat protein